MSDSDERALFRRALAVARPASGPEVRQEGLVRRQATDGVPQAETSRGALGVRAMLQERLLRELDRRELLEGEEGDVRAAVTEFVERVSEEQELALNEDERERLGEDLIEEALGIGPLAPLMADPAITDILVNGPEAVWVERFGKLERSQVRFAGPDHVRRIIERMAMRVGRRIDQSWPMVDMRLPDGSRVNATIPPASLDGPTLSIRRFGRRRLTVDDLRRSNSISAPMVSFLEAVVRGRQNVLISGGTGAGKSTLLGAICGAIPDGERVLTIEDTAELVLDQPHVVRLETRPPNVEGRGQITARDLVTNALRMRPTRILIGEVRGAEALDMLQAMNTGHEGGLTTIHANSPRDALSRLETMVLMAGSELPSLAIREQIASALHVVVHVSRTRDGSRRVTSIAEVLGLEGSTIQLQELFRFEREGTVGGRSLGGFRAQGIVPRCADELRKRGIDMPAEMFRELGPEA